MVGGSAQEQLPAEIPRFQHVTFADHVLHIFGDKFDGMKSIDNSPLKRVGSKGYRPSDSGEFSLSNRVLPVEIRPVLTNLCQQLDNMIEFFIDPLYAALC